MAAGRRSDRGRCHRGRPERSARRRLVCDDSFGSSASRRIAAWTSSKRLFKPQQRVLVLGRLSVVAKRSCRARVACIVGEDGSPVTEGAEVLRRVERQRPEVADATDRASPRGGSDGLSAVLDDRDTLGAQLAEPIEIHGVSEQVDRHDRANAAIVGERRGREIEIHASGLVDVHEHGHVTGPQDGQGRRERRERRREHPGSRRQVETTKPDFDRVEPAAASDGVLHAAWRDSSSRRRRPPRQVSATHCADPIGRCEDPLTVPPLPTKSLISTLRSGALGGVNRPPIACAFR